MRGSHLTRGGSKATTAGEGNGAAEGTLTLRAPGRSLTTEPAADDPALFPYPPSHEFVGSKNKLKESSSVRSRRPAGSLAARYHFLGLRGGKERPLFSFPFSALLPLSLCGSERRSGGARMTDVAMATTAKRSGGGK